MNPVIARRPMRSRSRGVALLLVLWVIAMLSIMLGRFALLPRTPPSTAPTPVPPALKALTAIAEPWHIYRVG